MNSLSLLIYGAEVVGKLVFFLTGVGLLAVGLSIASGIMYLHHSSESRCGYNRNHRPDSIPRHVAAADTSWTMGWRAAWVAGVLFALLIFLPSSDTIYLIAGSEAGEAVVTSETGQAILGDVQEILKAKVKELVPNGDQAQ